MEVDSANVKVELNANVLNWISETYLQLYRDILLRTARTWWYHE